VIQPRVSVILVHYRTPELAVRCLDSLRERVATPLECLLVDNDPHEGHEQRFGEAFPGLVYLPSEENIGFGRACNRAAGLARSPFIFLLNTDAHLVEDSVRIMLEDLEQHGDCGALGCRLLDAGGQVEPSAACFPDLLRLVAGRDRLTRLLRTRFPALARRLTYFWTEAELQTPRTVDWCIGAALMLRREAFAAVGGFDPRFFLYAEEMDLCRRLKHAGWTVRYTPETTVHHQRAASSGGSLAPERVAAVAAGQRLYYRRHHGRLGALFLGAAEVLASVVKSVFWRLAALVASGPERRERRERALWHSRYLGNYWKRRY